MTYLEIGRWSLEIGHIDLFGFLRIWPQRWTQTVLQATEIVFPCQPLWEKARLEISIIYVAWRLREYKIQWNVWLETRNFQIWYAMCFWKVKDGHLTILTNCPFPPFWSETLNSEHQICDRQQNDWKFYKFNFKKDSKMDWKWAWN